MWLTQQMENRSTISGPHILDYVDFSCIDIKGGIYNNNNYNNYNNNYNNYNNYNDNNNNNKTFILEIGKRRLKCVKCLNERSNVTRNICRKELKLHRLKV